MHALPVGDAAGGSDDPRARRRPERHVRSDGHERRARRRRSCNEVLPDWSRRVRLDGERDTLGLYLTGHPFEEFEARGAADHQRPHRRRAPATGRRRATKAFSFKGKPATVAGMVFDLGKRGSRVIFTLDDRSGRLEASMFEDVWQQYRTLDREERDPDRRRLAALR